jgi:hypothetical protein
MTASAFLSGHFSRGALLSVRMVSVGEMGDRSSGYLAIDRDHEDLQADLHGS